MINEEISAMAKLEQDLKTVMEICAPGWGDEEDAAVVEEVGDEELDDAAEEDDRHGDAAPEAPPQHPITEPLLAPEAPPQHPITATESPEASVQPTHATASAAAAPAVAAAAAVAATSEGVGVPLDDLNILLTRIGWSEEHFHNKFVFHDVANSKTVCSIFPLSGLKAVCSFHKKCICWLNAGAAVKDDRNPMLDLVTWGYAGRECSQAGHHQASQELKRGFGMKVRVAG